MNHIGAAVFLPQSIVARADIEKQYFARGPCAGGIEELVRRQIGDHQRDAALRQRNRVGASCEWDVFQ